MYYCDTCHEMINDYDLKKGFLKDIDFHENDYCAECSSDEIREIGENELCGICGKYHEYGDEYTDCAKEIYVGRYGEVWALKYISADNMREAIEYILGEPEEFVRFVCEREEAERAEGIEFYERAKLPVPKELVKANA